MTTEHGPTDFAQLNGWDKPYDVFLTEQLAGDEMDNRSTESRIATAFLRLGPRVAVREADNPQYRFDSARRTSLNRCAKSSIAPLQRILHSAGKAPARCVMRCSIACKYAHCY